MPSEKSSILNLIKAETKKRLVMWLLASVSVFLSSWAAGLWQNVASWVRMPSSLSAGFEQVDAHFDALEISVDTRFDEIAQRFDAIETDVRSLTLPVDIVLIDPEASGPLQGFCIEGQDCEHRLYLRRTKRGASCQVVGASLFFLDLQTGREFATDSIRDRPPRNADRTRVEIRDILVRTPRRMPDQALLCIEPRYVKCPGMIEGDAAITEDEPNCWPVVIRDETQSHAR